MKSPSSFSSSEETESNSLGGSLCLGGGQDRWVPLTLQVPVALGRGQGVEVGRAEEEAAGPGVGGWAALGGASYRSRHRICCLWCW